MYRHLDPALIIDTIARLRRRVGERFPDASLGLLIAELETAARDTAARSAWIQRPLWSLRLLSAMVVLGVPAAVVVLEQNVARDLGMATVGEFLQSLEAALGSVVFLGAGVLFVATWETRIKRRRALTVVHELRSMAHIVDMHQLTKDPERLTDDRDTESSPERRLSSFELGRYFDYCSETLSLISKVAAVYSDGNADATVLEAVDEVENLCTGLSRKIWQKIMLLDQVAARE